MNENENNTNEETIDEPVMEGATETFEGDEDPRKGQADPGLIRDPEDGEPTANPFG